jgi:hypothetical protein
VLGLGCLAVFLWLTSYSWVVGLTPPTRWIAPEASPWQVVEVAAVAVGAASLVSGLLLAWRSPAARRRLPLLAAVSGGLVAAATLLSLLAPA